MHEFGTPDMIQHPIFLAPHFDDVALSCGGTVCLFAQLGLQPLVVTLFGGEPHEPLSAFALQQHRWRGLDDTTVIQLRRSEELAAAKVLGAQCLWFDLPDAIYRDARYTSDAELFGSIHPDDLPLVETLRAMVEDISAPQSGQPTLFVPLAVGGHVDHQIARAVGSAFVAQGYTVWAYEDLPYAASPNGREHCRELVTQYTSTSPWLVFLTEELFLSRLKAIRCYQSQVAFIFREVGDMEETLRTYALTVGQGRLAERFWKLRGPASTAFHSDSEVRQNEGKREE